MDTDEYVCNNFLQNPYKNPVTGRKIKIGGPVHTDLVSRCKQYISYAKYLSSEEEREIREYCTGVNKTNESKPKVKDLMKRVFDDPVDKHILDRVTYDPFGTRFCRTFVPPDKELECQSKRRTILVLDFLGFDQKPLKQDYNFCDITYRSKIKYYLHYIPVSRAETSIDILSLSSILNSRCNALLIHIDVRYNDATGKEANDIFLLKKIIMMVNKYLSGYEIPIVVYNFYNEEDDDGIINRKMFPDITDIRVLNVERVAYEHTIVDKDGAEYIAFNRFDKYDNTILAISESDRLSCQWWFKRFFNTVFECGKGRLIQLSGTCYLTTAFNMIILGDYTKRIIISALNYSSVLFDAKDIKYIKEKTNNRSAVCVDIFKVKEPKERIKYYSKILYNTICGSKHVRTSIDIFKDISQSYFSSNFEEPDITKREGGNSRVALYRILTDLGINFLICDYKGTFYQPYSKKSEKLYEQIRYESDPIILLENLATTTISEQPHPPDIILYIETDYKTFPKIEGFDLETVSISIKGTNPNPLNPTEVVKSVHVITGFICDGYYKLYDSNNLIYNCDWTDPLQLYSNEYISSMLLKYNWTVTKMYISSAIYINANKRLQYIDEGVCTF